MNTYPLVLADSATMLRRNLRRMRRYPSLTFFIAGIPVVFLLLFVFVLGGTLGAGLGGVAGGRAEYTAYVLPGILLVTVAGAAQGTALSIAMDMTEGSSTASGRWPSGGRRSSPATSSAAPSKPCWRSPS